MKKFLIAFFVFCGLMASVASVSATYQYKYDIRATTAWGRWQDNYGGVMDVGPGKFGIHACYVSDVVREDDRTIVVVGLDGGKYVSELYFYNDNPDYFIEKRFFPNGNTKYIEYARVPWSTPLNQDYSRR